MTNEPSLPVTDEAKADLMLKLVRAVIHSDSADGRAGLGAVLRELREADPAAIEQAAAGIQLRRLGWSGMRAL